MANYDKNDPYFNDFRPSFEEHKQNVRRVGATLNDEPTERRLYERTVEKQESACREHPHACEALRRLVKKGQTVYYEYSSQAGRGL